jgi:uncharacterized Tic20 family protein
MAEERQDLPIDDQDGRVSRLASDGGENMTEPDSGDKPKRRPHFDSPAGDVPRSYSTQHVSDDERLWAAIAHGSVWITLLGGAASIGMALPISVFIPLAVYFAFRRRSDYVAFHALQAFVLQLVGTLGALILLTVGGIIWTIGFIVALLAMLILIGFVLVPLWGIVGIALLIAAALMPLAMLFLGTLAAIETYQGRDYRYPAIARWVDRQLAGGFLNAA